MKYFSHSFHRNPYITFWVSIFFATSAMALTVQLILLPYLFPLLHAGNGLLLGYDWIGFHQAAAATARKIQDTGWSSWAFRPAPIGVTSALYSLAVSEPYMLIPLNASLHATAGVVLMRIIRLLADSDFVAMYAALPFVIFPSAMAWYAQIHKESFYIAGTFLCLYGWLILARLDTWKSRGTRPLLGLLGIFFGCLLIWVVRPYGVKLIQGVGAIFALLLLPLFISRSMGGFLAVPRACLAVFILLTLPVALGIYQNEVWVFKSAKVPSMGPEVVSPDLGGVGGFDQRAERYAERIQWNRSRLLPNKLDNLFFTLSVTRIAYADAKGASNVDVDIVFRSASDFIAYLPRALQIGFFAPFPKLWVSNGSTETNTLMRRISGVEMVITYFALLFLPYAMWLYRRKIETWMIFGFCSILLLVYTYSMPNIGTLYRARYGFLMPLVGIGIIGGVAAWKNFQNTSRVNPK